MSLLRIAVLTLSFLVCMGTSNSHAQSPPPSQNGTPDLPSIKAERDALTTIFVFCLKRAAKRLDDHKSDASTIAVGMLAACGKELDAEVEAYSRYLPDYLSGREKVERMARQAGIESGIQMVLENRKVRPPKPH